MSAFDALVERVCEASGFRDTPYLTSLVDGSMSQARFIETQRQFYGAVVFFSRPMARLASHIDDDALRLLVVRNIWEEHGEGVLSRSHGATFTALLSRISGVDDASVAAELHAQALWPEVHAFNDAIMRAADDVVVGACTLGIIERMFVEISRTIGRAIVDRGFVSAEHLVHYNAHEVLDVRHADDFFAIVRPTSTSTPHASSTRSRAAPTPSTLSIAGCTRMRFLEITRDNLSRYHDQLRALEQHSVYPLGDDAFRIDHGTNYLAFFERLGRVFYYALEEDGVLVVVGTGVLREHPQRWYICDLKVHPAYRGRHLPLQLMARAFPHNYLRCGRGYGIAMNPSDGRVPASVRMMRHFSALPESVLHSEQLNIYSGDDAAAREAMRLVENEGSTAHWVSLRGIKDLILESSKQPLPLLHMRTTARTTALTDMQTHATPQAGFTHMWCATSTSSRASLFAAAGFTKTATATIVSHRLPSSAYDDVDTSEI